MKKTEYERPTTQVVQLKQRSQILAGSGGSNPYTPDNNPYNW